MTRAARASLGPSAVERVAAWTCTLNEELQRASGESGLIMHADAVPRQLCRDWQRLARPRSNIAITRPLGNGALINADFLDGSHGSRRATAALDPISRM